MTQHLFDERARLLQAAGIAPLLLFDPDASLFDGAAEVASKAFFDGDNIPAWDTWVFYDTDRTQPHYDFFSTFLVSWVPRSLIELANKGVQVNAEGCLKWAAD